MKLLKPLLVLLALSTSSWAAGPQNIPAVATVAALKGLGVASPQYPTVYVRGYNSDNDGGQGTFTWSPASTDTTNICTTFQATGVTTGRWMRQIGGALSVEMCGAYHDGTNSTATLAAFQAANDYVSASANPNQTIYAQGAHYNFGSGTTGVVKAASFFCPKWVGGGSSTGDQGTTVSYTPATEHAAFTFIGGSGSVCGGGVSGMIFDGNSNTVAVESQGMGGLEVNISAFAPMERCVLLHNKLTGQFTEFNHVTCNTNGPFGTVLEYRVTSGNASFHGSGLVGGVVNFVGGSPAILIGADAFPYNAPMTGTFFPDTTSATGVIIQNNSNTGFGEPWFVGTVTVERAGSGLVSMGNGNDFVLVGQQAFFGNAYAQVMGHMYLANTVGLLNSGLSIMNFQPISRNDLINGATKYLWPSNAQNQNWIINVEIRGPNYTAQATATLMQDAGTGGYSTVGQVNNLLTNTAGYGSISITADNTGITFNGASSGYPSSGLIYFITLTQSGQSSSEHQ